MNIQRAKVAASNKPQNSAWLSYYPAVLNSKYTSYTALDNRKSGWSSHFALTSDINLSASIALPAVTSRREWRECATLAPEKLSEVRFSGRASHLDYAADCCLLA